MPSVPFVDSCFTCQAGLAEFACGRCLEARFCGPECQQQGWSKHRPHCKDLAAHLAASQVQCQRQSVTVYPNVGAAHGEVKVALPEGATMKAFSEAVAQAVLGGAAPEEVRLFTSTGTEVKELDVLVKEAACGRSLVASAGFPLRPTRPPPDPAAASPRYDRRLVGSDVLKVDASDPELASLLCCSVPIVITNSQVADKAVKQWTFDFLQQHLEDVDNFFVLCAPAKAKGRFAYYDFNREKNPCGYAVVASNQRVEMTFREFRRRAAEATKQQRSNMPAHTFYLQNALLHREAAEPGPPHPVGGFGESCGRQVAEDIKSFDWAWLKKYMGGREVQMCQLFCGMEGGFSPFHYDPQDNIFAQIRGHKRVLLFHPRHFASLYPWPVHHPQDRQSRVDLDNPDLHSFPRFPELYGQGLEVVVGPGDILRIPPCWWHHVEMASSPPDGEVVSFNFWYTPPMWFHGSLEDGSVSWDRPLYGARRLLFQRCIEELAAHSAHPAMVQAVVRACMAGTIPPTFSGKLLEAVQNVTTFVVTVFPDTEERRQLLSEVVEGRFLGLVPRLSPGTARPEALAEAGG